MVLSASKVCLLAVNIGRQPLIIAHVQPPAIEVHELAVLGIWRICPIEAHDVIALVFGPYPPNEHGPRLRLSWLNIDNQSSHVTQKLTTDKTEFVTLPVKRRRIHQDHLRKPIGHVAAAW